MKVILIIIMLNSTAAPTAITFDDIWACEQAASAVRKMAKAKTICAPKGSNGAAYDTQPG
jgi:hypothetical protein